MSSTTAPTTVAADSGLSDRRTCGKGAVVYTDVARDSGSLLSPTSLGLAGAKGSSPDRQGTGGSGCMQQHRAAGRGRQRRRSEVAGKSTSPRLSPRDEPEEPQSRGGAAQPLGSEDGKTRDPTLRGCRK